MLKKAMLGVALGLAMVPVAAVASPVRLSGGDALVHVSASGCSLSVVLKEGESGPVAITSGYGSRWSGFKGTVRDMGKAVAYRFQVRRTYSGKTEIVRGLVPQRNGVATIALRPGVVPAVKG
jgi:hypothetical protein